MVRRARRAAAPRDAREPASTQRATSSRPSRGSGCAYDRLLLATGSVPRRISLPGADLDGVLYLRTIEDSDRLRAAFKPGARVVFVGGGWIGLEAASAAAEAGASVTVLEALELPLVRVLGSRDRRGVRRAPPRARRRSADVGRGGEHRGRVRPGERGACWPTARGCRQTPWWSASARAPRRARRGRRAEGGQRGARGRPGPHQRPGHLRRGRHRQPRAPVRWGAGSAWSTGPTR